MPLASREKDKTKWKEMTLKWKNLLVALSIRSPLQHSSFSTSFNEAFSFPLKQNSHVTHNHKLDDSGFEPTTFYLALVFLTWVTSAFKFSWSSPLFRIIFFNEETNFIVNINYHPKRVFKSLRKKFKNIS